MAKRLIFVVYIMCLACRLSPAQSTVATGDSRTVTEPIYPSSICATIRATKFLVETNTVSLNPYGRGCGDISGTWGVLGCRGAISYEPSSSSSSYVADESLDTAAYNAAVSTCGSSSGAIRLSLGTSGEQAIVLPRWAITKKILGDPGTHVKASRNLTDYAGSNCGKLAPSSSCQHWITSPNSSGLGIYGPVILDGRGWDAYIGSTTESFYTNRAQAYCNKHGGAINGYPACTPNSAGSNSYGPNGLDLVGISNFTIYDATMRDSGNFSVNLQSCHDVTVWGMKVFDPYMMSNTDGIDPLNCQRVTITNSYIANGDNPISIKAKTSVSSDITISHNQIMGIGVVLGTDQAAGIHNVLVTDNVHKGNLNNVEHTATQIGSSSANGGAVDQVTFQRGCSMDNTIGFRFYTNYGGQTGTSYPDWTNILQRNYHYLATVSGGHSGKFAVQGLSGHRIQIQLDGIWLDGSDDGIPQQSGVIKDQYADVYLGPLPVASAIVSQLHAGTSVTTTGTPGSGTAYPCNRAMWKPLIGELFIGTPTSNVAKSYNNTSSTSYILKAVLQPSTDISLKESADLTQPVTFLDNGVPMSGTVTMSADKQFAQLTVSSPPSGLHNYAFLYPGDTNYAAATFGSASVTNPGTGGGSPPPPTGLTSTVFLVQ